MNAQRLLLMVMLCLGMVACATVPEKEQDLFSGRYVVAGQERAGIFILESVGEGRWHLGARLPGDDAVRPFPVPGTPPMMKASPAFLGRLFADEASQRPEMTCLEPVHGGWGGFTICRAPVGASYRVRDSMRNERQTSESGYIFVSGTPAGVLAMDLVRLRP